MLRYGQFFSRLGLKTYVFYDRQKNENVSDQIEDTFDAAWELEHTGMEYLLAEETTIEIIRDFLVAASKWDDYPRNSKRPGLLAYDPDADDDDVRDLCKRVLKSRKGSGYAQRMAELCSDNDLPKIIVDALERISSDLPNDLSTEGEDGDDDDDAEETTLAG